MLTPRTSLGAVAALALLAACGGGDSNDADAVSTEPPTGTGTGAETSADTDPSIAEAGPDGAEPTDGSVTSAATTVPTTLAPTVPSPTTAGPVEDPACLVGEWVIGEDEMNGYYDTLGANAGAAMGETDLVVDLDLVGEARLELDGERFVYDLDFEVAIDVGGLVGDGTSSGSYAGTYTVEAGVIRTVVENADAELSVEVAGMVMTGADLADFLYDGVPIDGAAFGCDGPTIDFRAGVDPSQRHEVTLTAA